MKRRAVAIGSPARVLHLPPALRARLRQHAASQAPEEACGLLVGRRASMEVVDVLCLPNRAPLGRFALDPLALIDAEERAAVDGLEVLGPWHSHPGGEPGPSEHDHASASRWPGTIWVVVGAEITAWCSEAGALQAVRLGPAIEGGVVQSAARGGPDPAARAAGGRR